KGGVLGILLGAAFLTRASGLALVAAVGLYLLVRKSVRKGITPLSIALVAILGWAVWSSLNRSAIDIVNGTYYTSYLQDFRQIIGNAQAVTQESGLKTVLEMTGRNAITLIMSSAPIVTLDLPYGWANHLSGPLRIGALSLVFVTLLFIVL